MNKIFKVVWSKTKECYVVVSEVAKNNSGKKKVLASVLATLAIMGAGAQMGTPVQAGTDLDKKVNISPTGTMAGGYSKDNSVSNNSVVVGYGNTTTGAAGNGHVAYGFGNTATEDSTTAIGGGNKATGGAATAVGSFNTASGRASVAIGNVSIASAEDSIAIGNRANSNPANTDRGSGQFSIAVGRESWAKGTDNISIGHKAETNSTGDSIAMGRESKANQANAVAIGPQANANGWGGIAMGREAAISANFATAIGYQSKAEGSSSVAIGKNNTTTGGAGGVAIGNTNTSTGDRAISIGESNNSNKEDTISMGTSNTANTAGAIAIGQNNEANSGNVPGNTMIAIGRDNKAKAQDTIAIGRETTASKDLSVAIGNRTEATANAAIAIGTNGAPSGGNTYKTTASGFASIAVGMQSEATASVATAIGGKSSATGASATAVGHGATASEKASVAVGKNATVKKQATTSNYEFSGSNGTPSPAGYKTETITVNSASAPAGGAVAGNYYDAGSGVAIGNGATVSDESDQAVVVGADAKTNGNAHYSVVLGSGSHADASDGFVAGHGSYVKARESIAIGSGANVSGNENIRSQAIGYGATVTGTGAYDATAIGATAQVSGVQGGVALGAGSMLDRTTASNENAGWNSKNLNGTAIRNRAYTADLTGHGDQWDSGRINTGAVSVGNDTQKRQIINVAAGNKDTDAVNVAQLKNVGVRVGADTNTATITVGSNTSNVAADFLAYNGQLNIKGDNNRVTTVSENDANGKDANVNVKFDYDGLVKAKTGSAVTVDQKTDAAGKTYFEIDAAAGSKTVVADGKNTTVTGAGTTASPYKVNVEGALTGISSITNNGGGKIEFATGGTTISGGPVNVSNNKITGVANGDVNATSTDAVNGSQLHAVKAAERHIAPTTTGHEYTVDSNGNVTMTYLDGNNKAVTGEQAVITGIAKNDLSNITNEGKKEITKLGTIVKAGDNVNVSESSDATTGRTTYTVNAVTPAVYTKADGTKVYKRPDGTFTTNQNLAAGNNVDKGDVITSFMDGNGNTTGGNMVINNVGSAIDKTGTSTGSTFLTKLDTAATNTPNAAVNVKDLKTTSDALVDKGLRFDANEGNEKTNKLGSKVTVKGTGALTAGKAYADEYNTANIRTNIEQGSDGNTTINVGLAKALKDINSISNGNSSITLNSNPGGTGNTPAVSITGGNVDVGGNNITNLKSGGDTDSNAANIGDVKKIASDTDTHIKPGTYTVAADKTVTMTYVNGKGETVKANGQDVVAKIDLSGLPTGGTSSTEKVKKAANAANDTNIAEVNPQTGDTYGAADATYEVSVSRNAVKDAAREAVTVNNGGTTKADGSYTADSNNPISVTPTKDDNNHNTSYAVTFDGNKAAKQIPLTYKATNGTTTSAAQTVTLDKGLNFTGGDYTTASVGADGKVTFDVNLGTAPTVTDGKPGVPGQAGAAGKDGIATVKTVVDTINNSGWKANAKANGGKLDGTATATVVKPGNTVNYAAGKNLIVNQELETDASNALTGNQTYTYSLNKDIDLTNAGSLTVGDTTVNNGGITIKAPTPAAGTTATTDVKLTNTGLNNGGNTITNVAEGQNNTDAVNVKQLKANRTEVKAGDNVVVTSAVDATDNHTVYTVNAVTPAVYTTPDGTKLTKDKDGKFHKEGETAEYTGDIITSFENPKAATGQTTKDGGMIVNNIGSAIKNQNPTMPAGQTATYLDKLKAAADAGSNVKNAAVNVSDLHNTAEALKSNELHIRPTVTNRTGETVNQNAGGTAESYKYDSTTKSVTLKYNDGTGAGVTGTEAKIDLSDLANQITSGYTFKTNATENGGKVVNDAATPAAETAVANGGVVNYAAGKNLTVKQDIEKDGTGAATGKQTYTYALADEIGIGEKGQPGVAGKDGVDGKIGVNGKDGSSVVINGKDGSIGMTGPKGQDGKDGINGRDGANISMTSAKGEQVLINRDPAHSADTDKAERIVYVPKDASGNPIQDNGKNIVREVATMDDGLKFGGDMGTVNSVKLNKQVDVKGGITDTNKLATGNNIGVTSGIDPTTNNATLNVQLAKDLTGLNSVELGGNTIKTDGDHITITSPDTTPGATPGATTTTKVANLSDEKHIKEGTYAVQNDGSVTLNYQDGNKKDLTETAKITGIAKQDLTNINDAGKNVITGLGTIVKAGDNVTVSEAADATTGQKTYTVNAVTPAIYTDKNGNKVVKRTDGTYTTNLDGSAGNDVAASDVIVSFKDAAGNTTGGNSIVNNIGSAINNHATPGVTSPTYLDKLDAAAGDTKTQNAAVNVTDLKNTADGLTDKGLNFTGNNESTVNKHKLGSLVKVQGEGTKEGTNAAGAKEIQTSDGTKFESAKDNIAVEADSIDKLTIKLNKNLKGINSISNGSTSITLNDAPNATTPAVTIKGGNLSMGDGTTNNKIVNLAPGTADTDAVNYGQIKGLRTEVKPGANVTVNKTQGTDGHDIYTISATATGGTASSWNIKSSADTANGGATATGHDANAVNISDQKTVEMTAGKNLTVKQGATTDGAKVEFALSDKIGIGEKGQPGVPGKDGVDGKIGVNGKDGSSVVINGADGSIGMTGPKGQDGKDGIDGRDGANISMTSAKGEQVLINRDPAHSADTDKAERIVYVPKDASGNPIQDNGKNIVREVATMDDGLKFGGDMGTVNSVKLNKQVDVKGGITDTNKLATGNNIGVTSGIDPTTNNATLNVQLAKDLTGLNSVELGGNTIKTDGDHITITSPDTTPGATPGATTTTKVANLSDELHITPGTYEVGAVDKDANAKNDEVTLTYTDGNGAEKANTFAKIKGVAKSDLSNINTAGKKVITGLGSVVKAGDNVTVKTDTDATTGQKTYTVNAVTPALYTKADGTKVVKRPDGTFTTNVDGAPGNDVPASDVIVSFQDAAGNRTGGNSIVNNVGSAIDKPGTATGNTFLTKLDNAATDTPFAAVNVRDLKTTADALKANELHIAPTSGGTDTDKGGVVKTAGSTDMVYKYDAASKTVTLTYNDGNGKAVTGPKAVLDFTDLNIPAGGNNYGFKANATANGGKVANDTTTPAAATAVENGGTVNFAAGKNLTVKQDIDATNKTQTYTFSLDKDLTNLDKIVVNGKDGIDGKDGVSITGPKGESAPGAKDGQDGKVGIAGKDGKDAVSISGKDGVGHIGLTGPQGPAGTPGAPGTPGANIDISTDHGTQTLVKQEANNNEKSERIVYVPKDANGNPLKDKDNNPIKREVATMDDGLRFTGNNTSKENKQEMNSLVKVQGEGVTENTTSGKLEVNGQEFKSAAGNIAVVADGGTTLTVKMNKDLNLTKDGSVTMGDTIVNNDGITIKAPTTPGTTTTDVKLTNQGLDNGGNKITNVAAGTANTDAVNVKQLKDNVTTVESSDSSIKVVDKNAPGSATYDATKGHQYDITINNQGVVNNAQTPVVYTKKDGTKVYKQPNGTFTTNIDGTGTVVPANQVIASMNNADNSSTTPMKLNNVGSSIADETGTTFLDKLDSANKNTPNGAVNVSDLKSTSDALIDKGLVFDANNADPKTNKLGSKVTIAGTGALATGENFADKYNTDNIRTNIKQDAAGNTTVEIGLNKNLKGLESVSVPGKDGVDGQDGVSITGKDGANGVDGKVSIGKDGKDAVSISGKDGIGHIGLTGAAGKDGTNTKADITVKEGQPGLNGTDGITRIVYKDKDGNDHEVATHDDGVKYAGDDAQGTDKTKVISKKLNQTIDIVGGADKTKLTDNNIGVNNDGGKLKVQLIKDVNLTDTGSIKFGDTADNNTVINRGGITITTPATATDPAVTVSLTGNGLNNGGNKITNVKAGTDGTDAVNLDQLKAARTKVTSNDNSVTISRSENTTTGEVTYDLHVDPNATPDLNRVNNRIDQLGEEIGRVGAQGAALSALKPIQYDPLEPTQIMAGYGNYRGNSAVALGVAHYKNESTLIHGGVSWAGGSSHMMANAGVTWKVGNRDSEAAVADRYRKGPISSTYAMQQEMAAMKAQNAGLKGEVSDLKAENEQMKAQIAAMMAKLGL